MWTVNFAAMAQLQGETITSKFLSADYREVLTIFANDNRFIPGERILFKLENRLVDGGFSFVSKVGYLELIDHDRQSVQKLKIELVDGVGEGYLYLPSFLKTGTYTLIAYTSWMLNFPKANIPQFHIEIINPFNTLPSMLVSDSIGMDFYPEGNTFLLNESARVAFRLDMPFSNTSRQIEGKVISPSGDQLASFNHDTGLPFGHFDFTPKEAGSYRIVITDEKEHIYYFKLLVDVNEKLALKVSETEEGYAVRAFVRTHRGQVLSIQSVDHPGYTHKITVRSDTTFMLSANQWPVGLIQIGYEEATVVRYVYNRPTNVQSVKISTDKSSYQTREKIKLKLELPAGASFLNASVSVRKEYDSAYRSTYTSDPDYSLQRNNVKNRDDYLLTLSPMSEPAAETTFVPEYREQLVYGKVQGTNIKPNDLVVLSSVGETPLFRTSTIDKQGNFIMSVPAFFQDKKIVLFNRQADRINLTESFLTDYSFISTRENLQRTNPKWLEKKLIDVQIEDAYYQFKQDQPVDSLPSGIFDGRVTNSYNLDDYTRFPTLEETFVEITPELRLRERENRFHLTMPYLENKSGTIDTVLVLVDGIPVHTGDFLPIDPTRLQKIDLVSQQLKLGYAEYRGVAMFKSFSGDGSLLINRPGYSIAVIMPFQRRVNYYQPNYDANESTLPDYRNQLLWEPVTEIRKTSEFEFFASDITGRYKIVIQGTDENQNYYFAESYLEVEKK